jgi:hypothetical protein
MAKNKFPKWLLIVLIIFSALMITWQMLVCGGVSDVYDTITYIRAWNVLSHHFVPDSFRPPVYPLFIGPLFDIFGDFWGLILILIGNWTVWIIGCWATWHILQYFGVVRQLRILTIFAFLFFTGAWALNNMVQTEAFAVGSIPLLTLTIVRYLQTRQRRFLVYCGFMLFELIYLKPQFIYLIPFVTVACVYATYKGRRHLVLSLMIPIVTVSSLCFYNWCLRRYQQMKMPLSIVTSMNNYTGMRMAGLIYVDEIENPDTREKLRPFIEADPGSDRVSDYWEIWSMYPSEMEDVWRHAYALHSVEMNNFILHRFVKALNYSIFCYRWEDRNFDTEVDIKYNKVSNMEFTPSSDFVVGKDLFKYRQSPKGMVIYPLLDEVYIPFWVAWLSILLFTASYIGVWIKRRKFPVVAFMISVTLLGGYLTVFIGAPCDWGRLVTPFCMLLFSTMAILLDRACRRWGYWFNYKRLC